MILRIFTFFGISFLCPALFSQGLINNGAVITLDNGPYIYIAGGTNGDFTNQDVAGPIYGKVTVNTSGTIKLEGDWTNNSANVSSLVFTNAAVGEVEFCGSNAQSIGGASTTYFPTFIANNSSGLAAGITLNTPQNIAIALTLTNGVINTSSVNFLRLADGATTTIGNAGSYINGPMQYIMVCICTRTLNLPLGKGTNWRPAIFTPTHSNNATKLFYTAELFNANANGLGLTLPASLTHVSYVHYYTITVNNPSDFGSATLRLYYSNTNGSDDGVTNAANLGIAKDNGSGSWVDITSGGGSANGTGNILSASYSTQNTYFALANKTGGTNPLPVSLINFYGECVNENKIIKWATASEINNHYFSLEKSFDGTTFFSIASIQGAGNSNSVHNYSYIDSSASMQSIVYYRLKQVDYDGNTKDFLPIAIECSNMYSNIFSLFPNPSNGQFSITFSEGLIGELELKITDIPGRELVSIPLYINSDTKLLELDLKNNLSPGTYLVSLKNNIIQFNHKIVIY